MYLDNRIIKFQVHYSYIKPSLYSAVKDFFMFYENFLAINVAIKITSGNVIGDDVYEE